MKTVIFDTNVLLDLFVFNDFRAIHLKQALLEQKIDALASSTTLEEFADVISRPLFALDANTQKDIFHQWKSNARILEENIVIKAPWECRDSDDQIFLDLAFTAKPCTLITKDHEILRLASRAAPVGVLITADYNAMNSDL
jgi:putative PIN family toxin of toxin-antitoxin system